MHWQQGVERKVEKSCIASLEPIPRVKVERVHFFYIFGFWGVWSSLLQVILFFAFLCFRSLVGVSFYSFLFLYVCCQCTHQGGD
jgi:hypothetical protein